ncbi:MAG: hypothetical protein K8S16_00075 [Bacteroidales bacterium]|nr:hypothetical protein [Bacteroidales bacterium]
MLKLSIVFFLIPFIICSQTEDIDKSEIDLKKYKDKEVTIIGYNWIGPNSNVCPQKAIKINVNGVIIDTCYNFKTREISEDIKQNITDREFYIDLIKMKRDEFVNLQSELNNFDREECDESAKPYIIIVNDKGKEYTYGLRRFLHCFPEKTEDFMKNMEKLIKSIP